MEMHEALPSAIRSSWAKNHVQVTGSPIVHRGENRERSGGATFETRESQRTVTTMRYLPSAKDGRD
jgi:hypothetical protein